jgi:uncharacterized protein YcnI
VPAGSSDVELTFRVPNERDDANTVGVQVFFPTNLPLLTVDVLPLPGWSAKVDAAALAKPVQTDDGLVSRVVTDVSWTASGGGISPGQYEDFVVSAGAVPPQPGHLVFKALQTYSSGKIVRWIEVPSSHDPNPNMPAAVLSLTAPSTVRTPSPPSAAGAGVDDALAISAIVLSTLSLAGVAVALVARKRDARRLTVSRP